MSLGGLSAITFICAQARIYTRDINYPNPPIDVEFAPLSASQPEKHWEALPSRQGRATVHGAR